MKLKINIILISEMYISEYGAMLPGNALNRFRHALKGKQGYNKSR